MKTKPTLAQIAAQFRCSVYQVKEQFAKNSRQLQRMADKARATGRKVNGFTFVELTAKANEAEARSLENA